MKIGFEELRQSFEAVAAATARESGSGSARRARILDAATELFVRHGFRRTSVDEVARRAHVAKGTVYLYFPSKAQLLLQAVIAEKRRYLENLRPVFEVGLDARERLRRYVTAMIAPVYEMPLISQVMRGDREIQMVLDETDPQVREQAAGLQVGLVTALVGEAAVASGTPLPDELAEARARTLMALLYGSWFLDDDRVRPGLTIERYAEVLSDWLVAGVGTGSAG